MLGKGTVDLKGSCPLASAASIGGFSFIFTFFLTLTTQSLEAKQERAIKIGHAQQMPRAAGRQDHDLRCWDGPEDSRCFLLSFPGGQTMAETSGSVEDAGMWRHLPAGLALVTPTTHCHQWPVSALTATRWCRSLRREGQLRQQSSDGLATLWDLVALRMPRAAVPPAGWLW
jgi:hypothetical protein